MGIAAIVGVGVFVVVQVGLVAYHSEQREIWTPYYKVTLYPMAYASGQPTGHGLRVNNTWFQRSFDVSLLHRQEEMTEDAHAGRTLRFIAPFTLAHPERVLVLGSGLGNDTATALRFGVEQVTSVDIDARIVGLSDEYHPNVPYRDSKVNVVIDDARHFLTTSPQHRRSRCRLPQKHS